MTVVFIAALATACLLTAIEELLTSIGRWRGLVALISATGGVLVLMPFGWEQIFYALAATYLGLSFSILLESLIPNTSLQRPGRNLPRRIPPL